LSLKFIRDNKALWLHMLVPVMLGAFLYWLMCPDVYFVRQIDSVLQIHRDNSITDNLLIRVVRNYFLDALWSYSLYCTLIIVLDSRRLAIALAIAFAVIMEMLQITSRCLGTFDVIDIVFEIISVLIANVTTKNYLKESSYEEGED